MICTSQNVFDASRGFLNDTAVTGGEIFTNTALQPYFAETYRKMFNCLMGSSKRVQRVVYLNFPALTTVLNPATYNIPDMAEPEMVEERPAQASIAITSTSITTPIVVTAPGHGLIIGSTVGGQISGVAGTTAPWGQWFFDVIDANTFSLNGSMTDGVAGMGGIATIQSSVGWNEVFPIDLSAQGLDGLPSSYLEVYLWLNEQFRFRGCTNIQQLRITYWASGTPPTNTSLNINIDNCIDFLSVATAAGGAYSRGWSPRGDELYARAYGAGGEQCTGGLLGDFIRIQVASMQRGPQRRRLPFRPRRTRSGDAILG